MTVKNRKIKIGILLIVIIINLGWPGWTKKTVGTYSTFFDIKIGDGRNDGVQRIYCGCINGHIVEWSFNCKDTWEMVDCGCASSQFNNTMRSLWIGKGRGDGLNRVYGACANGNIYVCTYQDSAWEMKKLDSLGFIYTGIATGKTRNDDRERIYVGGYGPPVSEYTWYGSSWNKNDISLNRRDVWPLAVGQGRNDGIDGIYCPAWIGSRLREYLWNGSNYEEVIINSSKDLFKVVIGPGRNDGINRVYAAGVFGHINEFTYSSKGWEKVDIHLNETDWSIYGLCLGQTKIDGKIRLYSGAQYGDIREYSWNGNSWSDTVIDAITEATAYLTVGRGRNDDTVRLYATGGNNQLYEFTNNSPFVNDTTGTFSKIKLTSLGNFISYTLPISGNVRLALYNVSGSEVFPLIDDEFQSDGPHTISLPWKDNLKFTYPSGIYICRLTVRDLRGSLKIAQIK